MKVTVKIAGIPVAIPCIYPENEAFFHAYLTCSSPLAEITGPLDLSPIRTAFEKQTGKAYPEWFLENNAIHRELATLLVDYDVLLVHASAIALDREAYVFMAASGTGKSTHTRLWRERFGSRAYMLNDDKPMLRLTERGVYAYGTPWDGKHRLSRNASAPVRAVVELTRDTVNHLGPCPDAFRVLFQYALRCKQPERMRKILRLEQEITRRVAFYRLGCNMSPEAADVAYAGITKKNI